MVSAIACAAMCTSRDCGAFAAKLVLFASSLKNSFAPGNCCESSCTSRSAPGSGSATFGSMVGLPKASNWALVVGVRSARRAAMLIEGAIEIGLRSIRYLPSSRSAWNGR